MNESNLEASKHILRYYIVRDILRNQSKNYILDVWLSSEYASVKWYKKLLDHNFLSGWILNKGQGESFDITPNLTDGDQLQIQYYWLKKYFNYFKIVVLKFIEYEHKYKTWGVPWALLGILTIIHCAISHTQIYLDELRNPSYIKSILL